MLTRVLLKGINDLNGWLKTALPEFSPDVAIVETLEDVRFEKSPDVQKVAGEENLMAITMFNERMELRAIAKDAGFDIEILTENDHNPIKGDEPTAQEETYEALGVDDFQNIDIRSGVKAFKIRAYYCDGGGSMKLEGSLIGDEGGVFYNVPEPVVFYRLCGWGDADGES